jgi:hypothetical protein
MAPEIRPLFTKSMVSQGRMLANMIKSVVVNIARMNILDTISLSVSCCLLGMDGWSAGRE